MLFNVRNYVLNGVGLYQQVIDVTIQQLLQLLFFYFLNSDSEQIGCVDYQVAYSEGGVFHLSDCMVLRYLLYIYCNGSLHLNRLDLLELSLVVNHFAINFF